MSADSSRIVICGAGIAGISAAYHLAVEHGHDNVVIVEEGQPLSLTSDKSTEAYRNWWPGPDCAMTAFMNRSIDLIEAIARATGNRINLNRRGYAFATADPGKISFLKTMAMTAEARGGGPARIHDAASSRYTPSPEHGFDFPLDGADVITDAGLIRRHFPYLAPETVAVAHARRAGWLSAQQLGMVMLEAARERGAKIVRGKIVGVDTAGGRVRAVHVDAHGERRTLEATHFVVSAGPMQKEVAALVGVALPVVAERHHKISFSDTVGAVPRSAPMLIWLDEQLRSPRTRRRAGCSENFRPAPMADPTGPAPRSSPCSTFTAAPTTSSFRCRSRRTTARSCCAACRPWCRPSRLTPAGVRGPMSTAATISRRARTGR
jgi:glycine/D-amino acid oxidase-like deaminating enzyme